MAAIAGLAGFVLPAHAADASGLFFEGDMVRGATREGATGPSCVLASQFKRRELVVWRVRVRDTQGKELGADTLKSLTVKLPDGQTFPARFGPHPRGKNTDQFWAAAWTIPADYPTGTFAYSVVATDKDGQEHAWSPFNVAPSQLTIINGDVTFTK